MAEDQVGDRNIILECKGVSKVYDNGTEMTEAVSDVSFKISAREMLLIFGPSGSGRSTLISILMGLNTPDIGEVLLKGESFYELSERERNFIRVNRIGIVPAKKMFMKGLNAVQNVALPLVLAGQSDKAALQVAKNLMEEYGVGEIAHKLPSELIMVEQQIIAILRAVIINPWILFADEPNIGLDQSKATRIMSIIEKINQEKMITTVVSLGDVRFLMPGKKLMFIHDGKIETFVKNGTSLGKLKEAIRIMEQTDKSSEEIQNENIAIN